MGKIEVPLCFSVIKYRRWCIAEAWKGGGGGKKGGQFVDFYKTRQDSLFAKLPRGKHHTGGRCHMLKPLQNVKSSTNTHTHLVPIPTLLDTQRHTYTHTHTHTYTSYKHSNLHECQTQLTSAERVMESLSESSRRGEKNLAFAILPQIFLLPRGWQRRHFIAKLIASVPRKCAQANRYLPTHTLTKLLTHSLAHRNAQMHAGNPRRIHEESRSCIDIELLNSISL